MAFSKYKNSTPARMDLDLSGFDSERRATAEDLKQAKYRYAVSTSAPWEMPIFAFAQSTPHDKEALLQVLLANH